MFGTATYLLTVMCYIRSGQANRQGPAELPERWVEWQPYAAASADAREAAGAAETQDYPHRQRGRRTRRHAHPQQRQERELLQPLR